MAGDEIDPHHDAHDETAAGIAHDSAAHGGNPHALSIHFSMDTISRATSPGPSHHDHESDGKKRYRPRTFSYFRLLPFDVEPEEYRDAALSGILKNLYIAVRAEDFSPGALHWTRELQGWMNLKFEMTRELRAKLTKLYYHLSLAPGLDPNTADRFTKMVVTLTRYVRVARPCCFLRVALTII
jgi:proteasome activator subunit 4